MKKTNYKIYEKKILGCVFRVIAKNDLKLTLTKNNIWFFRMLCLKNLRIITIRINYINNFMFLKKKTYKLNKNF